MTDFVARFYRPILSAINLAVELGSNFAEKIGGFYHSSVIGLRLLQLAFVTFLIACTRSTFFRYFILVYTAAFDITAKL